MLVKAMIAQSIPAAMREILQARGQKGLRDGTAAIIYLAMKANLVGGAGEMESVLNAATRPAMASTPSAVLASIRAWRVAWNRAAEMSLELPDVRVRCKALTETCFDVVTQYPLVDLELKMLMRSCGLPHAPTEKNLES